MRRPPMATRGRPPPPHPVPPPLLLPHLVAGACRRAYPARCPAAAWLPLAPSGLVPLSSPREPRHTPHRPHPGDGAPLAATLLPRTAVLLTASFRPGAAPAAGLATWRPARVV